MSHSDLARTIAAALNVRFPGACMVTPGQALIAAQPGAQISNPESAATQRIQRGTYPFPVRRFGGRRVVFVSDMVTALTAAAEPDDMPAPQPEPAPHRGPGRPRKVAPAPAQSGQEVQP